MMKKILLTDVFNLYNRGEQLQIDALINNIPNPFGFLSLYSIINKSYCVKNNIEVLGSYRPFSLFKLFPFLLILYLRAYLYKKTKLTFWLNDLLNQIRSYTLAINLGGETFTTNSNLFYAFKHIYTLNLLNCLNIPYVILSQTITLDEGLTSKFAKSVLDNALFISVRDEATYNLMLNLEQEQSFLHPDIAFISSKFTEIVYRKKLRIGVNASPFVKSCISQYVKTIQDLIDLDYDVVLIPHVTFDDIRDDRIILKEIYDSLQPNYQKRTTYVFDDDFDKIRDTINSCNILVGSRMHMIIYGLSVGIPCILTSYSSKSVYLKDQLEDNLFLVYKDDSDLANRIIDYVQLIDIDYKNYVVKLRFNINKIKRRSKGHIDLLLRSIL